MGQTLSSVSYTNNNAAKDDIVGGTIDENGYYTFTIKSLFANDPGSVAKLDFAKQFFFGEGAYDQAHQAQYLSENHIVKVNDLDGGTYKVLAGSDFEYSVQIGNKGTWSLADVDVADAPPPPPAPHTGDNLFTENFDEATITTFQSSGVDTSASIDLKAVGWTGTGHNDNFGFTEVNEVVLSGKLGGIEATSGPQWLDTQNTPGGIHISHTFTDNTAAPSVGDKTSTLSFDMAMMSVEWDGRPYETDPNASFSFRIDGQEVKAISNANTFGGTMNTWMHFDVDITGYANAGTEHTLELVDNSAPGYFGFALDSIQINDWVV